MNLLNKTETRRHILARLEVLRPALHGKLDRVSEESLDYLGARLHVLIDAEIRALGSVGKTIYLGRR